MSDLSPQCAAKRTLARVTFSGGRGPQAAISIRPVSILDQRAHLAHDASRGHVHMINESLTNW
jgi:hypothetical protein